MSETKSKKISLRITDSQKVRLGALANCAGLSLSEYLLAAALSEEKIVILEEGRNIAAELHLMRVKNPDNPSLVEIAAAIRLLTAKLSDLPDATEVKEENC